MKKVAAVLLGLVILLLLAWSVVWGFAFNAERKAKTAFAAIAPDAALAARYPLVASKNASAARLEELALPLGIDIRPRDGKKNGPEFDGQLRQSMSDWLTKQQERPDDVIEPAPENVRTWLDANAANIDTVAAFLAGPESPRWPQREGPPGERLTQPLPNLLGHMNLFRTLTVAALDRASRGDQTGAWNLLRAAWSLDRGLRERREVISQLIAVAGVKMIASSARKLQPPAPEWLSELSARRFSDGVYDAIRFESAQMSAAVQDGPTWSFVGTEEPPVVAMTALWPAMRWAVAENHRALSENVPSLATASPCTIDQKQFAAQLQSAVPEYAFRFAQAMNDHVPNAVWRGANADLTIEGTRRILALKAARRATADGSWPAAFGDEASALCPGERWSYAVTPEGATLKFTRAIEYPAGYMGAKVPTEYVAAR